MLELQGVSFAYKKGPDVLKNVSLQVEQGEFLIIAGRNGSGKTTVTKLLMSLIKPKAGRILFRSEDTAKKSPADMARAIGYVFQNPDRQIFRDTVLAEISYGPEQLGFGPEKTQRLVEEAMAATGLNGYEKAYPKVLSKGLKQRVAIASALAMDPEILILDEPTSGQDPIERTRLLNLLAELNAKGITIILVTHDMEIMAQYGKRAIVFSQGTKVFDGSVAALFSGKQPVEEWGLRLPGAVMIARGLQKHGIASSLTMEELLAQIRSKLGGQEYA